jgi:transcriptional regulator with XRE-family HTH domain
VAELIHAAQGFCKYGEDKGLLTPGGLRFAISERKALAKQLDDAGVSQQKIATLLGVSPQTINYDLNGRPPQSGEKSPQSGETEEDEDLPPVNGKEPDGDYAYDGPSEEEAEEEAEEEGEADDEPPQEATAANCRTAYLIRTNQSIRLAEECRQLLKELRKKSVRIRRQDEIVNAATAASHIWATLVEEMEELI